MINSKREKYSNKNYSLIFQHIPKSGGSTLHSILKRFYNKENTYNIFAGDYSDEGVNKLQSLAEKERKKIQLLKGHMPFGLHEYLSSSAKYVTVLRDPVKRVISQYFYIKINPQNPLHETVVSNDWSVGQLVRSGKSVGLNNGLVRWLTGEIHALPFDGVSAEHLEMAKQNIIRHYLFVGINEKYDESLLILADKLSWLKKPYYRIHNLNKKNKRSEISEEDIDTITSYNQYDIELYEFAVQRLEEEVLKISDFEGLVESFKRKNKIYQWLNYPLNLVNK